VRASFAIPTNRLSRVLVLALILDALTARWAAVPGTDGKLNRNAGPESAEGTVFRCRA